MGDSNYLCAAGLTCCCRQSVALNAQPWGPQNARRAQPVAELGVRRTFWCDEPL